MGRSQAGEVRFRDQPFAIGSLHHRSDLPGALADRDLFQKSEATAEDQDFCGHQREGGADADLDSIDCHAAAALAPTESALRLVLVQSAGSPAATIVCLSRFVPMAGRSLYRSTCRDRDGSTAHPGARLRAINLDSIRGRQPGFARSAVDTDRSNRINQPMRGIDLIWTGVAERPILPYSR